MSIEFPREKFKAFLRSKEPTERYKYENAWSCAIAQFFQAEGFPHVTISPRTVHGTDYLPMDIPADIDNAVNGLTRESNTFGQALARLEALEAAR